MVNILARTKDTELLTNVSLERLSYKDITWFWVDFESPDEEEIALLSEYFKFADLSIEDCLENLERPKVDYFDTYNFFVFHALNETTLEPIEVDLCSSKNHKQYKYQKRRVNLHNLFNSR